MDIKVLDGNSATKCRTLLRGLSRTQRVGGWLIGGASGHSLLSEHDLGFPLPASAAMPAGREPRSEHENTTATLLQATVLPLAIAQAGAAFLNWRSHRSMERHLEILRAPNQYLSNPVDRGPEERQSAKASDARSTQNSVDSEANLRADCETAPGPRAGVDPGVESGVQSEVHSEIKGVNSKARQGAGSGADQEGAGSDAGQERAGSGAGQGGAGSGASRKRVSSRTNSRRPNGIANSRAISEAELSGTGSQFVQALTGKELVEELAQEDLM